MVLSRRYWPRIWPFQRHQYSNNDDTFLWIPGEPVVTVYLGDTDTLPQGKGLNQNSVETNQFFIQIKEPRGGNLKLEIILCIE